MKRAYLAKGTITQPLIGAANTLTLDSATWMYLDGLLGTDYCYLAIGGKEIVKVIGLQTTNVALVERGVDSTQRNTWPTNSSIAYAFTEAELNDAVAYVGAQLNVEAPLQSNNGVISYPELSMVGIGGCTVEGDNEGIYMIQDIPANAGCCSILGQLPPPIPPQYLNLRVTVEGHYRASTDGAYRAYL